MSTRAGIRRILFGELTIDSPDGVETYREGEWWHEGAEHPVLATASATEETAFVRVIVLPAEWAGKRTIRYLDPATRRDRSSSGRRSSSKHRSRDDPLRR